MQKAQKATAETKAQSDGGLRLKGKRRIVELQLLQCIAQVGVFCAICRIDAAEYHRLYRAVARQRLARGVIRQGDGVAHTRLAHRLDRGGNVADLAGGELRRGLKRSGAHIAALHHGKLAAHTHHTDGIARMDPPVRHPHMCDNAPVGIVIGVENKRLERRVPIAARRRYQLDDLLQHLVHILPGLGGNRRGIVRRNPDDILNFPAYPVRVGAG